MAEQFVWTCPGCGRAVPKRLALCRCGQARGTTRAETAAPAVPVQTPPQPLTTPRTNPTFVAFAAGMSVAIAAVVVGVLVLSARATARREATSVPPGLPPGTIPVEQLAGAKNPSTNASLDGGLTGRAPLTIEEIVTRTIPAVVTVDTRRGHGSGFFVAPDTLLTNAHVVHDYSTVVLRPSGGSPVFARVVTAARDVDLAVLRLDRAPERQVWLPLGSPSDVQLGAEVIAIGSPLGLQNTVTRGIVSGIRTVKDVNVLQTDAAINPGSSGGPLIDRYGRVIGVTTLKLGGSAEAIGFAVSIQYARVLLERPQ
jgi:S1-C subfamily serine protease